MAFSGRIPRMACANKLFPLPLEPSIATTSPSSTLKVKSEITFRMCCSNHCKYCVNEIETFFTANNSLSIL